MSAQEWAPPSEHNICAQGPAPRFMQGALLGNGGLGVVVNTRPDAVVLRLGHNDIWDERIDETHGPDVLDFATVLSRVTAAANDGSPDEDPWFSDYRRRMEEPYARPFPRPYPCGHVVLGIDRRRTRVLGHELELASGVCRVSLMHDGHESTVEVLVDPTDDVIVVRVLSRHEDAVSPVQRVRLLPDPLGPIGSGGASTAAELAIAYTVAGETPLRPQVTELDAGRRGVAFAEELPARSAAAADRHALIVQVTADAELTGITRPSWYGGLAPEVPLERGVGDGREFRIEVGHHRTGRGSTGVAAFAPGTTGWAEVHERAAIDWAAYWSRSRVRLSSHELERTWYRNTYFTHCALRSGRTAPGIFGNWSSGEIGTAWHGDYHMNYNTQQLFWGVFSSNRVDSHEPYVRLVQNLLELSSRWARDYFGLPGAYFPHSAYPLPMSTMPFPSPIWGWEICETPWTVQSLWWHYTYTKDRHLLEHELMAPLEAATKFMLAYLERDAAYGIPWPDDKRHIFPTVVPEVYGLTEKLAHNHDCIADLTLTRFLFRSYIAAAAELDRGPQRQRIADRAGWMLDHLVDYPTQLTPDGPVLVSVPGENPDVVYNIPLAGMTVFPGEDHSWLSSTSDQEIVKRSIRRQRLEGGNELVFFHLQAARMGMLDPEVFLAQLRYCEMPNGTLTDMVLQAHGRYTDATPFEFMSEMGVFVENFAVTAVINELLMQSSTGVIRVFPNDVTIGDAEFHNLRAVGAFLVSAASVEGACAWIEVTSEAGGMLELLVPWTGMPSFDLTPPRVTFEEGILRMPMEPGQKVRLSEPWTE